MLSNVCLCPLSFPLLDCSKQKIDSKVLVLVRLRILRSMKVNKQHAIDLSIQMTNLSSIALVPEDGRDLIVWPKKKTYIQSLTSSFDNQPINPGPAAYPILDDEKEKYFNDKLPINGLNAPKKANQFSFGLARYNYDFVHWLLINWINSKKISLTLENHLKIHCKPNQPCIHRSVDPFYLKKRKTNLHSLDDRKSFDCFFSPFAHYQPNWFNFSKPIRSKFETPAPNSYPIFNREKMNSIHPNETKLKPTMRAPHNDVCKSNSPSPNTYPRENGKHSQDFLKRMISGPSAPAFSIRQRFDWQKIESRD